MFFNVILLNFLFKTLLYLLSKIKLVISPFYILNFHKDTISPSFGIITLSWRLLSWTTFLIVLEVEKQ
jgi:hypothetical protein